MHRRLLLSCLPIGLVGLAAQAETPAERASRQLHQEVQRDRVAEAGGPEGPRPVEQTPAAQALDVDRRSFQPDVGRPEESGSPVTGGEMAATGGGRNPQR
ncbi:hypothetical protein [Roseicella frigidaeris]|uniref:Uncharacterized protein n=1 Tax=Roseicella frigidaeris TaxID=2230885 RepID=A0A327M665_9PROT|nr:hypothetical protein [Roseicella frigidaeris]RAI57866.1 hypothetical protein DOO78_16595 [Roseicella frigidaeris]